MVVIDQAQSVNMAPLSNDGFVNALLLMDEASLNRTFEHIDAIMAYRNQDGSLARAEEYVQLGLDGGIVTDVLQWMQQYNQQGLENAVNEIYWHRPEVLKHWARNGTAGPSAPENQTLGGNGHGQMAAKYPFNSSYQHGAVVDNQLAALEEMGAFQPALQFADLAQGYQDPAHISDGDALRALLREQGSHYKGYITSYDHSQRVKAVYLKLNHKPGRVGTRGDFPLDNASQVELVRQLCTAIANLRDVIDGHRMRRGKRGIDDLQGEQAGFVDSAAVQAVKALSPVEVELLAWEILYALKNAQEGLVSVPSWGKDWKWKDHSSFLERFDAAIESLTKSKTTVKSLLGVNFMERLAADPQRELKRKVENKDINMKRDYQVKAGNHAIETGKVVVDQDYSLLDEQGNRIAPGNNTQGAQADGELGRPAKRQAGGSSLRRAGPVASQQNMQVPVLGLAPQHQQRLGLFPASVPVPNAPVPRSIGQPLTAGIPGLMQPAQPFFTGLDVPSSGIAAPVLDNSRFGSSVSPSLAQMKPVGYSMFDGLTVPAIQDPAQQPIPSIENTPAAQQVAHQEGISDPFFGHMKPEEPTEVPVDPALLSMDETEFEHLMNQMNWE